MENIHDKSLVNSLDENQGKDSEISINPIDSLPENMAGIVNDLSVKLNWNPEFCLLPMLVVGARAIGNARFSHIAGYDVISVLFGATVALPSTNKSTAFKFALKPLQDKFNAEWKQFEREVAEYKQLTDEEKKGETEPVLIPDFLNDATIEVVNRSLQNNPRGCIIQMDELKGLLLSFKRQQGSNAEQKLLSLFNGTAIIDDRIQRGTTYSGDNPRLSIVGTIQPDVIHRHFKDTEDNGFVERFLFAYPDAEIKPWNRYATKGIENEIQSRWKAIVDNLLSLNKDTIQATETNSESGFIPFNPEAKKALFDWNEFNTERKRENHNLNSILGKMDIVIPRLALILQLIENPNSTGINEVNAQRAIQIGEYYILNAQKVSNLIKYGAEDSTSTRDVAKRKLYSLLPDEFETKDATTLAGEIDVSVPTIKRYLNDNDFFESAGHGKWRCKSIK